MKIGVISDTHLNKPDYFLEKTVEEYFRDVDFIIHAGDFTSLKILDVFKGKKFIAVSGNNDSWEVKNHFPKKKVISAGRFRIGITHGWGLPWGIEKRISSSFDGIDCLIFGHSHWALKYIRNEILYFNPGSFSGGLFSLWKRSIGLLTIGEDIHGRIIRI